MSKLRETYFDKEIGKFTTRDLPINPQTQEEADLLYQELSHEMADEVIYQDGQASEEQARDTFLYWLEKAKEIEKLGFKPTIESDVFYPVGNVPNGFYDDLPLGIEPD